MQENNSNDSVINRENKLRRKKKIRMLKITVGILGALLAVSVVLIMILCIRNGILREEASRLDAYKDQFKQDQIEIGELKERLKVYMNSDDVYQQLEDLQKENKELKERLGITEEPTEKPTEAPTETPTEKSTEAPTEKPTEGKSGEIPVLVEDPIIPANGKVAYLTFDDGPSEYTPQLLEILAKYNVKATFFVNWKPKYKEYYKMILDAGHALGNHSYDHEWSGCYSSVEGFIEEITKLEDLVYAETGYKMNIMRFPGGTDNHINRKYNDNDPYLTTRCVIASQELGYTRFDWNVESRDADGKTYTAQQIVNFVVQGSKNRQNAVILMHDAPSKKSTREALEDIILGLQELGFTFDKLSPEAPTCRFNPWTVIQ